MKFTYIASLLALALTGCATPTSPQVIDYAAKLYYYSQACAQKGLLDQETAAKGIAVANKSVYSTDSERVNVRVGELRSWNPIPVKQVCDDTRLHILSRVAGGALTPPTASTNQVKTTNCSTYFGQTHCTSF